MKAIFLLKKKYIDKPNVAIVDNALLERLISKIENLEQMVISQLEEISEAKKPYLTLEETGRLLNMSEKWMHTNKHEIGCSKTGGKWLFQRKHIREYIEQDFFKK